MEISSSVETLVWVWIGVALVVVPVQHFVTPPYGRHRRSGWGPTIDNRVGWTCMEAILLVAIWFWFSMTVEHGNAVVWLALLLWSFHYGYRALIYPWRTRTRNKQIPLVVVALAALFNLVNGALNGFYLGQGWVQQGAESIADWRTLLGVTLFCCGWVVNFRADNALLRLRHSQDGGYHMPSGRLFTHVSCPNFLGELIIWTGFAVLCWNLAALAFAIWTAANLIPRALAHHRWYAETFAEYPPERRAIIPYLL